MGFVPHPTIPSYFPISLVVLGGDKPLLSNPMQFHEERSKRAPWGQGQGGPGDGPVQCSLPGNTGVDQSLDWDRGTLSHCSLNFRGKDREGEI